MNMVKVCSMVYIGNPSGFVLHQEQGMGRVIKDIVPLLPSLGVGQDTTRLNSSSLYLRPHQLEESWKPVSGLLESNKFVKIESTATRPVLADVQVQDAPLSSVLFSYGIAEKCTRHDKILQLLMSGSSEVDKEGLDLSLLSELMGLQMVTSDVHQLQFVPPLNCPISEHRAQKPLVDFVGDLGLGAKITVQPDGRVLLTGTGSEMKDLLSLVAEFYSSTDLTLCRKQSLQVPAFKRLDGNETRAIADVSSLKLEALTVAPLKSPEKTKLNPSQKNKKKVRKIGKERDLYKKNSSHACESLLSLLVLDMKRHGKTTILKSGPELPELLTQISAGIAGTGIAVLFSFICSVARGSAPFSASKLFNAGFGVGLIWLAWAVNGLRNIIILCISKNPSKLGMKDEEMMEKVSKCVKEVHFRAATLMALAMMKLA